METLIRDKTGESYDLIKDIQHGFTKGRSYVTKTNRIFRGEKTTHAKKDGDGC